LGNSMFYANVLCEAAHERKTSTNGIDDGGADYNAAGENLCRQT
jgi:hypothetical protein